MRLLATIAVGVALSACQSIEDLQARVGNASNFQLCRAIFLAPNNVATIARGEAERRALDCRPYASAVFQNEAQADAARNALAQQLLQGGRPAMTCHTIPWGLGTRTVCD